MEGLVLNNQHHDPHSNLLREALASSSIGWEIALPIAGGALFGQLMDRALNTTVIFTLVFLFLGVASGAYNLFRHVQRISAQRTATKGHPISDEEWEAWDEEWQEEEWDEDFFEDEEEKE